MTIRGIKYREAYKIITKKTNNNKDYSLFIIMITGELIKDKIIIENAKDASRLYNKNRIGKPISNNKLEIDLIEGVFLLDGEKIQIFEKKGKIAFQKLVEIAAKKIPDFLTKYQIYKDIRNRGYAIKLYNKNKDISFSKISKIKNNNEKKFFISVFSEREYFDIKKTLNLIKYSKEFDSSLWYAILDEESDITYYDVSKPDFIGETKKHIFSKSKCLIFKDTVIISDKKTSKNLFEKEFFGKPFGEGLQLSYIEALYLSEKDYLDLYLEDVKVSKNNFYSIIKKSQPDIDIRFKVFSDLKNRGFIVKTGFKFGSHFRVYTKQPDQTHAEYLVHVVNEGYKGFWSDISRAVRLAHSVNKEIVFAIVDGKIDYIKLGRLRP